MLRNFQLHAPSHRPDLDWIAEAPDGTVAAFAALNIDMRNRFAVYEPVGTHPDHRRKGLARAVMTAALRRLQSLEIADMVYVANWGTANAAHLYAAVGLEHYATVRGWVKIVP
jgi:ribosomal protein S18 acetylase RimI-like enzyme